MVNPILKSDMKSNKGNPFFHLLLGLPKAILEMLWYALAPLIYLAVLLIAGISESPWVYHPILLACLFAPAVVMLVFAFTGQSRNIGWLARIANLFGTSGYLVAGSVLLILYGTTVWAKIH